MLTSVIVLAYNKTEDKVSRRGEVTYLENAGQREVVEHRKEEMGSEGDHDDVTDPHHPVFSPEHIHFSRSPEQRDGRHEASEHRQRYGQSAHVAVGHEKLLRRVLFAARATVVQSDAGRDGQHQNECDIVPWCERRVDHLCDVFPSLLSLCVPAYSSLPVLPLRRSTRVFAGADVNGELY